MEAGPVTNNRIEELWKDHNDLAAYLQASNELHLLSTVQDSFRKTLLIAAASYFEVRFTETIVGLYQEADRGAGILSEFVRRKAIGRSFASLFNWDSGNANSFYNLFGPDFSGYMKERVRADDALAEAVKAFIEIGHLRNELVHKNYADFRLDKTVDEIYRLYHAAAYFLSYFPVAVGECIATIDANENGGAESTA